MMNAQRPKLTWIGIVKSLFMYFSLIFWIPSLVLLCVSCYAVLPGLLMPVLKMDTFKAEELFLDRYEYHTGWSRGVTTYGVGPIINLSDSKRHVMLRYSNEVEFSQDSDTEYAVKVYHSPLFSTVYYRKPTEPLTKMPGYKVINPFFFAATITVLPFPICLYGFLLFRRQRKFQQKAISVAQSSHRD